MKRSKRIIATTLTALLVLGTLPPRLHAEEEKEEEVSGPHLGLRTDFGDIFIENLGIGQTYNLRQLAGTPLKVRNTSSETLSLLIDVQIPTEKMITPKRRNMGFVEVPSVTWVEIGQSEFNLPPGETAFTDVILRIPDDPSLYGKKFQASIHSRSIGKNFIHLGVWSHLVFTIIQSPEAQAKQEKLRKRGLKQTAEFNLLPSKLFVENVPLGRKYNLRKENKKTVKIANTGENPVNLKIEVIQIAASPLSLQGSYKDGVPGWLKAKDKTIKLDVDSIYDPGWVLNIPDKPEYRGKQFMLAIKVEPVSKDIVSFTFYGRIYIHTQE